MEVKQNPFSVYDFLGYLIPGALLLYLLAIAANLLDIDLSSFRAAFPWLFSFPNAYIPFAIVSYLFGHTLSFLSSLFVERYAIWNFGYPSKFLLGIRPKHWRSDLDNDPLKVRKTFVRLIACFFCFPFVALDVIGDRLFRVRQIYAKSLDPKITALVKRKLWLFIGTEMGLFKFVTQVEPKAKGRTDWTECDFFRAVYHYVLQNYGAHASALKNYVALYGFLRTITLLFTLLFWCGAIRLGFISFGSILGFQTSEDSVREILLVVMLLLVTSLASYVFFMAFVKFYRRYTLEALMALAANYAVELPDGYPDPYAKEALAWEPSPKK